MAIIMSSADTILLVCGTTVSNDIVRVFRSSINDNTLLKITRVTILVVGVIGTGFALYHGTVFDLFIVAAGVFVSGILVPVFGALYWKKATSVAGFLSAIVGILTFLTTHFVRLAGKLPDTLEPVLLAIAASTATLFVIGMISYDRATVNLPLVRQRSGPS